MDIIMLLKDVTYIYSKNKKTYIKEIYFAFLCQARDNFFLFNYYLFVYFLLVNELYFFWNYEIKWYTLWMFVFGST